MSGWTQSPWKWRTKRTLPTLAGRYKFRFFNCSNVKVHFRFYSLLTNVFVYIFHMAMVSLSSSSGKSMNSIVEGSLKQAENLLAKAIKADKDFEKGVKTWHKVLCLKRLYYSKWTVRKMDEKWNFVWRKKVCGFLCFERFICESVFFFLNSGDICCFIPSRRVRSNVISWNLT